MSQIHKLTKRFGCTDHLATAPALQHGNVRILTPSPKMLTMYESRKSCHFYRILSCEAMEAYHSRPQTNLLDMAKLMRVELSRRPEL